MIFIHTHGFHLINVDQLSYHVLEIRLVCLVLTIEVLYITTEYLQSDKLWADQLVAVGKPPEDDDLISYIIISVA